tara:strand:+ start:996 stop:1208 length:213 start_codon:yes stop_codon:yes gene_type:complete
MKTHNTVPDANDEIERKSVETVQWLIDQYSSGQVDAQEYRFGMQVIWQCTTGLIDSKVSEAISNEVNSIK